MVFLYVRSIFGKGDLDITESDITNLQEFDITEFDITEKGN